MKIKIGEKIGKHVKFTPIFHLFLLITLAMNNDIISYHPTYSNSTHFLQNRFVIFGAEIGTTSVDYLWNSKKSECFQTISHNSNNLRRSNFCFNSPLCEFVKQMTEFFNHSPLAVSTYVYNLENQTYFQFHFFVLFYNKEVIQDENWKNLWISQINTFDWFKIHRE